MYWVWTNSPGNDDAAVIHGVPPVGVYLNLWFDDGVPVTINVPLIEIQRNSDSQGMLNDNVIAPGVYGLLLSSRVRRVLAEIGMQKMHTIIHLYFCTMILTDKGILNEMQKGTGADISYVVWLAVGILIIEVVSTVGNNIAGYWGDQLSMKLNKLLSSKYYEHLLSLPQSYFDGELSGKRGRGKKAKITSPGYAP